MATYKLAPLATVDIQEIWEYIAQNDEEIATLFIRKLIDKFILIANNRLIGASRQQFQPDIRVFPYRNYSVFYSPRDFGVEIIRVLHNARDIESIFEDSSEE